MLIYYILSLISILIFTQSSFIFWPIFPILFAATRNHPPVKIYSFTLITGLVTDLLVGKPLGLSSLVLLLSVAILSILKSHFHNNIRVSLATFLLAQIVLKIIGY